MIKERKKSEINNMCIYISIYINIYIDVCVCLYACVCSIVVYNWVLYADKMWASAFKYEAYTILRAIVFAHRKTTFFWAHKKNHNEIGIYPVSICFFLLH